MRQSQEKGKESFQKTTFLLSCFFFFFFMTFVPSVFLLKKKGQLIQKREQTDGIKGEETGAE